MTLLLVLLVVVVALAVDGSSCPLWTSSLNGSCKCGSDLRGMVSCDDDRGILRLKKCFCMTTERNNSLPLVGTCLYTCNIYYPSVYSLDTNTTDDLNNNTCGPFKRTGVMCGECLENYGLPAYSYDLSCVECSDYKYNWLKYIAVAYIPLTLFYFVVITLRISATSGYVIGYVTISQMLTIKSFATLVFNMAKHHKHIIIAKYMITYASIWNLDFFRSVLQPFCLLPQMSSLQVLLLDYAIAVYPMLLVLLTFLFLKLHENFRIVVRLCNPLYRCLHFFKKEWDIKNSLIGSFATFYLLSYVKILNATVDIMTPTSFFKMNGEWEDFFVYYNPSIPYLGKEHLPYVIFAIIMCLLFNIFPLLLLFLYLCPCFHRILNKMACRCHTLHIFMDAVLGAYTHRPRERRYFGALYLILRIVHVFVLAPLHPLVYPAAASYILIIVIVSLALFTPYKNKWHNAIDIVLFSAILHCYLMVVFYLEGMFVASFEVNGLNIYSPIAFAFLFVISLYGVSLFIARLLPWKFIRKCARIITTHCKILYTQKKEMDESLPYRIKHDEKKNLLVVA